MKEIELKFKLKENPKFFHNRLKAFLKLQKRTKETTIMYDNKSRFMQKSDGRLRIRTGYANSLSYKKPITRNGIKEEIEFETEIGDANETELIIKELGYNKVSGYTRNRTIWKVNNVKVFLDEFSFGNYIEIEGSEKDIIKIASRLGFKMEDNITKSYDGIYKEICEKKGIKPKAFIK